MNEILELGTTMQKLESCVPKYTTTEKIASKHSQLVQKIPAEIARYVWL